MHIYSLVYLTAGEIDRYCRRAVFAEEEGRESHRVAVFLAGVGLFGCIFDWGLAIVLAFFCVLFWELYGKKLRNDGRKADKFTEGYSWQKLKKNCCLVL